MSTKTYPTQVTTGFGSALWAHLKEADKKFSELGDFKVNLKLSEKDARPIIEAIEAEQAKALIHFQEEAKKEGKSPKAIAKIKLSDIMPFEESDEEDDVIIFKFKRKAAYIKDGGEINHFDVPLIDATGKTIPDGKKPDIGNGSTIRVMADLIPYNMATSGVGVSLRLKKVQIKDLVEFSSDGPGFDAIEDGGYVPEGMDEDFGDSGDSGGYSV